MAPMEGITDVPFRKVVRHHGCAGISTQMIHAEGLLRGTQRRIKEVMSISPEEHPVGLQLCGSEPKIVGEAAKKAEALGADFIDINMGCPAKNVVKLGGGAALMKEPFQAAAIVCEVKQNVTVPVTVKIRAGWNEEYRTAKEVGYACEQEGASWVAVHARTRAQKFKGKADWNLIKDLKQHLSIPVIGNGDVSDPNHVQSMINSTGADGVMVGRGALGNPWIFQGRRPTVGEIRETLLTHLEFHLSFYEITKYALMTFRKHLVWYTKGLANAASFRLRVFQENSHPIIMDMIQEFFDQFDPNSFPEISHD